MARAKCSVLKNTSPSLKGNHHFLQAKLVSILEKSNTKMTTSTCLLYLCLSCGSCAFLRVAVVTQLRRSDSLQSLGISKTIATKLFEERHCWRMYPNKKTSAMFIITVLLDCICQRSSRSAFPFSSSQDLSPDSKPSVCSHEGFASIMIFCIRAHSRFRVSGAYRLCISRHA